MRHWNNFHKILGILFVVTGIITYIVPIPGSTLLIVLGLVWLIGKNKTLHFFREILGKKLFKFLKIKRVVEKV